MATKLDQLKEKLRELFQLDRPDLDFGFYRIMHAKQAEIDQFLDQDLLPQVKAGLSSLRGYGNNELAEAVKQAKALGVDPEKVPRVRELKVKYGSQADSAKVEDEIYSHLYRFFARYYDNGDFISMRRYKEGVYAIPYEGEEVVLHWANKDQYYIKSSEALRDYTVKLGEGDKAPRMHFKLVEADMEKDNRKAADDKKRLFIFNPEKTEITARGVVLGFEYRADPDNRKQEVFITACVDYVKKNAADFGALAPKLLALSPTEKRKDRTLLEKHLTSFTANHSMDYFIHKDLGGFLRRELDFYIKNEVMHLDDIENESAPHVEQYLAQVRVIRGIAHKLIDFLAQLEDFQKKLWLKKKFVVETNWCITLDRVPEKLYPEIASNQAQWAEWEKLGFVEPAKTGKAAKKSGELELGDRDLPKVGTVAYLKAFPFMVIDTALYDAAFKQKLLASIENIDEQTDGLLIHSENLQALNLLQSRFKEQLGCVYIDPPYNTDASPIIYKNGYRRSSWIALMMDRLSLDVNLCARPHLHCVAIDDFAYADLIEVLGMMTSGVHHATAVVRSKPQGRPTATGFSSNHEYAVFWGDADANIGRLPRVGSKAERYPYSDEQGVYAWANFRKSGTDSDRQDRPRSFYPIYVKGDNLRIPEMSWNENRNEWEIQNKLGRDEICVYPVDPDGKEKVWTCSPERARAEFEDMRVDNDSGPRIQISKKYRPDQRGALPGTWWDESSYSASESGTKLLKDLFGAKDFDYPKSVHLVHDCLRVVSRQGGITILDYFGGSGTTGHAVINLNREDCGKRKYILVEMGNYFDTVLKPRIQKVVYSSDWKDGKPTDAKTGISHCLKYLRLESYEDCLNNLELKRAEEQDALLKRNSALKEDYTLRYMLDVESEESLLNVSAFADPFSYTLKVAAGSVGETKRVKVDLVETFNYLIGLKVKTMDVIRGITVVTGENLKGEKILVLWRNTVKTDSDALNAWFIKQGYNTQDMEYDIIYVNGDNHLENLRKDEETWKVRLIEEEFLQRMFAGEGV